MAKMGFEGHEIREIWQRYKGEWVILSHINGQTTRLGKFDRFENDHYILTPYYARDYSNGTYAKHKLRETECAIPSGDFIFEKITKKSVDGYCESMNKEEAKKREQEKNQEIKEGIQQDLFK